MDRISLPASSTSASAPAPTPSRPRPLTELAAEITELAGHLNAATHRWLKLIAEFDRRNGWSDGACHSCAHWLNFQCGIALGAAREKVRVARALENLPNIAAAMARGELSYSKARALTRIASAETEEYLLNIALHGTAHHVERVVRYFRRAKEAEELSREAQQQATRSVSYFWDDDGSLLLKARLPAEIGALLVKALDAATEEISTPPVPQGTSLASAPLPADERPSFAARRADALGVLAESFIKHGGAPLSGGERHQIVVHVDAQTLREGIAGQCEVDAGPSVPAETARRLACDCSAVLILENEKGEPLNVGRKTRRIPPALRRALHARDRGCRFPGCTHTRYVDAHHVQHWAQGGETKPSNLVTLCRFHHRKVHEGGIVVQALEDGAFRFVRPDGRVFESVAPRQQGEWTQLLSQHAESDIRIDKTTATTRWRGEHMDYSLAVESLLAKWRRAQDVPAGT
ncbi:MAG TPA: DUF222 domain-containing protein, partial [Steroidobacteraceae bacterium]|nr:DUF222 domain-containing protein [Steroidobacteraceae bacterium]